MNFLLTTILSALTPVVAEAGKQAVGKWLGGPKPVNVDEQIKLDQSEIEKLKTIAQLDNPYGTPSQWVIDLRASCRYILAILIIVGGGVILLNPAIGAEVKLLGFELISIVFGFLFGSRLIAPNIGKK